MPDGSIKKTNKTVIHNVDENGQGYFYHSVHHVIHSANDQETEDHVDDQDESTGKEHEPQGEEVDETTEEPKTYVSEDEDEDDESTGEDIEPPGEEVDETAEEPPMDVEDVKSPGEDKDPKGEGVDETAEELSTDVPDHRKDDQDESPGEDIEPTGEMPEKDDLLAKTWGVPLFPCTYN